jgi:hypothetical protein
MVETLESRQLLTSGSLNNFLNSSLYLPSDYGTAYVAPKSLGVNQIHHPIGSSPAQLATLTNEGKVVTGQDRNGDRWSITVQGPGLVIVTDATPTDGVLDDNIDTIQLVGTNINTTHVIARVQPSAEVLSSGTILFNKLIAQNGVASIDLNGFVLSQTVTPPNGGAPNSNTGIYLQGGVRQLTFQGIDASIDLSQNTQPITISNISNTVFDSTSTTVPTGPVTYQTVNVIVNGQIHNMQMVSATQAVIDPALAYLFPIVGTTGRTTVQTTGMDNLTVRGSAINTTFSRASTPFQNGLSGMSKLGSASFGGNADALGIDVNGKVGRLKFARGLGSPVGVSKAATNYGIPAANLGYPANGLVGGLITANSVGSITAAPANSILQTPQDPNQIQILPTYTNYSVRPGSALSSAAIVSSGNIGTTTIVGNATNSEIKSGTNYPSMAAGLQGTRAKSKIGPLKLRGDLVDSVVSATYRPGTAGYGTSGSVAGNGTIRGRFIGQLYNTGGQTILLNKGTGFYAKHKSPTLVSSPTG